MKWEGKKGPNDGDCSQSATYGVPGGPTIKTLGLGMGLLNRLKMLAFVRESRYEL
jgi:hypothetical protein